MKKLILTGAIALLPLCAFAQNVQFHYDFGHNIYDGKNADKNLSSRGHITTTVEMFRPDSWGSTYFFIDMDYLSSDKAANAKYAGVQGAYWEISREFCFWQDTKMDWLAAHVEYDGGLNTTSLTFNNAWLAGLAYNGHSKDFSKTWSLQVLYKGIPYKTKINGKRGVPTEDESGNTTISDNEYTTHGWEHGFQITGVWGINFAHNWCTFSGFFDFWKEYRSWQGGLDESGKPKGTRFIFLSEPQFWVNLNQIKGMEKFNLSLGGEVELSYNFAGTGFFCIPTLAAKWTF